MSKLYISQPITVSLTCLVDELPVSTGVSAKILYQRPDKTEGEWPATMDNATGIVEYDASESDINVAGKWKLQPSIVFAGGNELPGDTVEMRIEKRFA